MRSYKQLKRIEIVYFSGTGGTQRAADLLSRALTDRGVKTHCHELHKRKPFDYIPGDMLVILYPVYAFNAPKPIYDFIETLPKGNGSLAAVLSISGGGEVTPNNGCRIHTVRRLHQKGYRVPYERMLVMPSNIFIETPDRLSLLLLQALPDKINRIATDLLSGKVRRTKPNLLDRLTSSAGELEKLASPFFGKLMRVNANCNGCGLCERSCPMGNITRKDNLPSFGDKCILCLRCVYHCPKKSITASFINLAFLRNGYHLEKLELKLIEQKENNTLMTLQDLRSYQVSYALAGVKKYLQEED